MKSLNYSNVVLWNIYVIPDDDLHKWFNDVIVDHKIWVTQIICFTRYFLIMI